MNNTFGQTQSWTWVVRHAIARSLGLGVVFAGASLALTSAAYAQDSQPAAANKAESNKAESNKIVPLKQADLEALTQSPDDTVTRALINILKDRGMLTQQDADGLLQKLDQQAASRKAATEKAANTVPVNQNTKENSGKVRVIYLPQSDENKLREDVKNEVKQEVMQTARDENWAAPNAVPAWVKRTKVEGDVRFRYEGDLYSSSNDNGFIDFNTVNNGSPLDEEGVAFPFINSTQDRQRPRFRGRLELDNNTSRVLSVGMRFVTGNTSNPVSPDQTYGPDFNKYQFLVDRMYVDYHPFDGFKMQVGRMPNPWFSTPLVWDADLNFDGISAHYDWYTRGFKPFATIGAFPLENTALDFSTYNPNKYASRDKWLFGSQLGSQIRFNDTITGKFGLAYYYFLNVNGKKSSPCDAVYSTDGCDTDNSRALFVQKGNTLMEVRTLSDTALESGHQYQYFGLASPFHELVATSHFDFATGTALHLMLDVDYVNNLAYNKSRIESQNPVNNYGSNTNSAYSNFEGGNQGYFIQTQFGYPQITERGEWNFSLAYRLVQTDATLDAFTDSDFHLGGTNAKGYIIGGSLGVSHNAWLGLRYSSADEVTGAPFSLDVLQLDLTARF